MKLIIEPDDSAAPLHAALKSARKTLEIAIFRFDRSDIEALLKAAVADGVKVTALVADVNRGGEKNLRELEKRFLENGITVARTSADLIRYHDNISLLIGGSWWCFRLTSRTLISSTAVDSVLSPRIKY